MTGPTMTDPTTTYPASAGTPRLTHHIGGVAVAGTSGRTGPVYDPATGAVRAQVDLASAAEVDTAVATAAAAFPGWRATSVGARTAVLFRFRQLLDARRDEMAALVTAEHGKVPADALGEVARGMENVDFACGFAHALKGEFTEQAATGVDVYSVRQPLGVVAGITPFNFPAMVPMWMFATALACGNAFVLKPSEKDPSPSLLVAELLAEAGLPAGVFNVVQGDKVAVDRLLAHPDVAAVSFVGSTPIGRHVYETGTAAGKRVQALGGAKNHMVVLPDADVDAAADAAVSAAYGSAGERCMAVSVVVAVGEVADTLVPAIAGRLDKVVVGPGTDPAAEMGPLITAAHRDKVAGYLDTAAAEGAALVVDGREQSFDGDGFFLAPSLVDHVTPAMTVYRDEVFGPVLSVVRADTYAEAVELVNANPYGNGTAIFTRDGGAARRFQFEAEAGMVGVNVPIPVPVAYYSFGGWKASLFGDLHMYGPDGLRFYTRTKVVTARWPDPATSAVDLGFPRTH
jgi:malonate-semialdehyde dehydrogenase (acetylating)/methylmalonate-semialdehyde dehydrogenase